MVEDEEKQQPTLLMEIIEALKVSVLPKINKQTMNEETI